MIKRIEKDERFEPNESRLCDWCAFPEYCPAKKHGFKVEALPANKYLNEKGVSLVNEYAKIKGKINELETHEAELEKELKLIEEAAIEYAKKEGITSITGSDHLLKISEKGALKFPGAHEKGRDELESYLREAGLWLDAATLNLSKLVKMIQEETVDPDKLDHLKKFAEESTKVSVRLVKKKETEE